MSLSDEAGLGPDPAAYAPLGQPGAVPPNDELVPDGTLADDPLGANDDVDRETSDADGWSPEPNASASGDAPLDAPRADDDGERTVQ